MNTTRYRVPPFKHQLTCLAKHGRQKAFALNSEMGTGKTFILICNIADLWEAGELDTVLVMAPNGVHTNWINLELPKHMPEWVRWRATAWSAGMSKTKRAAFDAILAPSPGTLRILAANWEALVHKSSFDVLQKFCESGKRLMIVGDESHNIKNPSSVRTKNLFKLRNLSEWRRTMSGTPITQGPFDAFSQYSFLNPRILGTTSYFAFKSEYAEMQTKMLTHISKDGTKSEYFNPVLKSAMGRTGTNRVPQIVQRDDDGLPKYKNLEKLAKLVEPYTFRVLKTDCLDLPKKIFKSVLFEMTPQQRKAYEKARDECRLVYENEETAFAKLVAVTKLAQITSGYYLHPDAEEPVRIEGENPKLDILVDRVRAIVEQGSKVIIWARYHVEIDDLVRALSVPQPKGDAPINIVQYHGRVKAADREAAKIAFQDDPSVNVFIGQQQAGGAGITLTAASYVIYYSNDFSLTNRLQSEDRAHRIGQEEDVVYLDIMAEGTISQAILSILRNKKSVADIINGDGRALGVR